jgi:hypothetical protein
VPQPVFSGSVELWRHYLDGVDEPAAMGVVALFRQGRDGHHTVRLCSRPTAWTAGAGPIDRSMPILAYSVVRKRLTMPPLSLRK